MDTVFIVLIVILGIFLLIYVLSAIFSYRLYRRVWMIRTHEVNNPVKIRFEDIEDHVEKTPFSFPVTDKKGDNRIIEASLYSPKDKSSIKKPLILLSPGYGRTHLSYLVDIGTLTSWGYEVLAYDQYGTGLSSGNIQGGIHYGRRTLSRILDILKAKKVFGERPIYLYGHSWGGYSVLSSLKTHPEIEKVVARSPAGKPILSSYAAGAYLVGKPMANYLYFCSWLPLFLRFGPKAFVSAQGIVKKNMSAKILITSCKEDPVLPVSTSPIPYFEKHPQKNVTLAIKTSAHIHNDILTQEGWDYYIAKEKEYAKLIKSLGPSYVREMNEFEKSVDRSKITIDQTVAKEIKDFLED